MRLVGNGLSQLGVIAEFDCLDYCVNNFHLNMLKELDIHVHKVKRVHFILEANPEAFADNVHMVHGHVLPSSVVLDRRDRASILGASIMGGTCSGWSVNR